MSEPVPVVSSSGPARRRRRRVPTALGTAILATGLGVPAAPALADHVSSPPFMVDPFVSAAQEPGGTAVTARVYAGISGFRLICSECSEPDEEERARNLGGRVHAVLARRASCPVAPPAVGGDTVLRIFMGPRGHPWRPLEHGYYELETVLRPDAGWAGEWIVCAWFEYAGENGTKTVGPFTERTAGGAPDRVTVRAPTPRSVAGLAVTAAQLQINDRIARTALHRAAALEARLAGREEPDPPRAEAVTLSAAQLLATQRVAQAALRREAALRARLDGRPAPEAGAARASGRVSLTPRQLLINQRIAQAAVRRLNLLEARLAP